jgi:hypothetical protein
MSSVAAKLANGPTPEELRRKFETAIVEINQQDHSYRTPLVPRHQMQTLTCRTEVEKRAQADAARALAQLWKISRTSLAR